MVKTQTHYAECYSLIDLDNTTIVHTFDADASMKDVVDNITEKYPTESVSMNIYSKEWVKQ